jgi:hypothetical protein
VLKTALDKEISKAIDHEWIGLVNNCLDNIMFLFGCADFQLLLQENRGLLIVTADYFVYNIFPITRHILVKEPSIVERLKRRHVCLNGIAAHLENIRVNSTEGYMLTRILTAEADQELSLALEPMNSLAVGERGLPIGRGW